MQFLELFCRTASAFHHETLQREGAQLRRAIETCRLEFSIELLLQHMNITIIRDEGCPASVVPMVMSGSGTDEVDTDGVQASAPAADSDNRSSSERQIDQPERGRENATLASTIEEITMQLAGFEAGKKKLSRHPSINHQPPPKRSVLFSRLPPRRSSPTRPLSSLPPAVVPVKGAHALMLLKHAASNHDERSEASLNRSPRARPPQVIMIREIASPPPMPASVLHLVESAIKYQNVGQFNVSRCSPDQCAARKRKLTTRRLSLSDGSLHPRRVPISAGGSERRRHGKRRAASIRESADRQRV